MKGIKIQFGIIGCGMIANWHAKAIKAIDGAELAGVTDFFPESAQNFAQKYHTYFFESSEKLLSCNEIDIVSICTPSGLHAPQAVMAANAGKHIITEKPMALNM